MPFFDVASQFLGFDLGAYNGEIWLQTGPTPPPLYARALPL